MAPTTCAPIPPALDARAACASSLQGIHAVVRKRDGPAVAGSDEIPDRVAERGEIAPGVGSLDDDVGAVRPECQRALDAGVQVRHDAHAETGPLGEREGSGLQRDGAPVLRVVDEGEDVVAGERAMHGGDRRSSIRHGVIHRRRGELEPVGANRTVRPITPTYLTTFTSNYSAYRQGPSRAASGPPSTSVSTIVRVSPKRPRSGPSHCRTIRRLAGSAGLTSRLEAPRATDSSTRTDPEPREVRRKGTSYSPHPSAGNRPVPQAKVQAARHEPLDRGPVGASQRSHDCTRDPDAPRQHEGREKRILLARLRMPPAEESDRRRGGIFGSRVEASAWTTVARGEQTRRRPAARSRRQKSVSPRADG